MMKYRLCRFKNVHEVNKYDKNDRVTMVKYNLKQYTAL